MMPDPASFGLPFGSSAAGGASTGNQVTCAATATAIYTATTSRLSITIQNQTPGTNVWIGTASTITTATAPILLSTTTGVAFTDDRALDKWYCVTSSGTAVVGYIVRK